MVVTRQWKNLENNTNCSIDRGTMQKKLWMEKRNNAKKQFVKGNKGTKLSCEGEIELLMKFNRSGRYEHYLAVIATTICSATTTTQNCNTTANCIAPRDRYVTLHCFSSSYDRYWLQRVPLYANFSGWLLHGFIM